MFGDQWSVVRKVLTTDIETALDSYWARVRQEEKEEGVFITPAAEVRELRTPLHYQNPVNARIGCHHPSERSVVTLPAQAFTLETAHFLKVAEAATHEVRTTSRINVAGS